MRQDLDSGGLRAIVTGGSSGIGAAITERLRRAGAAVVVVDVDPPTVAPDWHVKGDVGDTDSVAAAVKASADRLGGLDVVINNAGIGATGSVEDATTAEWHRVLNVNVVGTARVSAAAMPHLRRSDRASIVNVCSIAATAGLPQRAVYSASKGAVLSLTLAMAADSCGDGIRVNCVCPGTVDTPWVGRLLEASEDPVRERRALADRQPLGRLGTAAEVAEAVAYLAGPQSSWTTGTALAVDGGMAGLRLRPRVGN